MQKLFYPESITVIGASANTDKLGYIISNNIIQSGYSGNLFLVNPNLKTLFGKTVFTTTTEITSNIDLSIIVVPATLVSKVLEDLGKQKDLVGNLQTTYAVIISSGFKETGEKGTQLETDLVRIAAKSNIRLVGPNCLGVMNLSNNELAFNGTFDFLPKARGGISLVSQSGALVSAILEQAQTMGFGFNKIISLGNKSDINENDLIKYLENDKDTQVIALYIESYSAGEKLFKILQSTTKPVVIFKSGRSQSAKKAASTHTGSIAGDQRVARAFIDNTRAVEVFELDEFFDTLNLLSKYTSINSKDIFIITNAGGLGVVAVDGMADLELNLKPVSRVTQSKLSTVLPPASSLKNPIDVLGDSPVDRYEFALKTILDNEIGSVIVILTPQVSTNVLETAKAIDGLSLKYPDRVVIPIFIGGEKIESALLEFHKLSIPTFSSPEAALKALNNLYLYQSKVSSKNHQKVVDNFVISPEKLKIISSRINDDKLRKYKILDFATTEKISETFDINLPKYIQVSKISELDSLFERLGSPIVIKSVKTDILHKTEQKAVLTGVSNVAQIKDFLDEKDLADIIFQQTIDKGIEVFAGISVDPNFGQVLVVGTGGIYAEAIDDFALGPLPDTIQEVKNIFKKTKIAKIMSNYRNIVLDSEHLYLQVLNICRVARYFPEVLSIDANPIIVTSQKAFVVDFKLSLI